MNKELLDLFANEVREHVAEIVAPLQKEIADLKKALAATEKNTAARVDELTAKQSDANKTVSLFVTDTTKTFGNLLADFEKSKETADLTVAILKETKETARTAKINSESAERVAREALNTAVKNVVNYDKIAEEVKTQVADIPPPEYTPPDLDMVAIRGEIKTCVEDTVASGLKNLPAPKAGKAGRGVASATINREGELVLTYTDETKEAAGYCVGPVGMGFDDLRFDYDGERHLKIIMERDLQRREFDFEMPLLIYTGVYDATRDYAKGDAVTDHGGLWVATTTTSARPSTQAKDWKMAAKGFQRKSTGTPPK